MELKRCWRELEAGRRNSKTFVLKAKVLKSQITVSEVNLFLIFHLQTQSLDAQQQSSELVRVLPCIAAGPANSLQTIWQTRPLAVGSFHCLIVFPVPPTLTPVPSVLGMGPPEWKVLAQI